jgi:flagellar hook-length control protein FliK
MLEAIKNIGLVAKEATLPQAHKDAAEEFSDILGALDNGDEGSNSSSSVDSEMVNILADQFSSAAISRATSARISVKRDAEHEESTPVKQSTSAVVDESNRRDGEGYQSQQQVATDSQESASQDPVIREIRSSLKRVVDANKVGEVQAPKELETTSAQVIAPQLSEAISQGSAGGNNEEASEAGVAVRNLIANQGQNIAAGAVNQPTKMEAATSGIMQSVQPTLDIRGMKPQIQSSTETQRAEPIAKSKEIAGRSEEQKSSKVTSKKDFQLAVQKIEDALKEAVAAKDGKSISLKIEQPTLGPIKLDITLKDGSLYARIVVESQQVGNALREKSQEIIESLKKLGLGVDSINVFIGSSSNNESFSQNLPQQTRNNSQALKILMNDASNLDARALAPGLVNNKGFESGWIA